MTSTFQHHSVYDPQLDSQDLTRTERDPELDDHQVV